MEEENISFKEELIVVGKQEVLISDIEFIYIGKKILQKIEGTLI